MTSVPNISTTRCDGWIWNLKRIPKGEPESASVFTQTCISSERTIIKTVQLFRRRCPSFPIYHLSPCKESRLSGSVQYSSFSPPGCFSTSFWICFKSPWNANTIVLFFTVRIQAEERQEKEGQHCCFHGLCQSHTKKKEGQSHKVSFYYYSKGELSVSLLYVLTAKRLVLGWEYNLGDAGSHIQVGTSA